MKQSRADSGNKEIIMYYTCLYTVFSFELYFTYSVNYKQINEKKKRKSSQDLEILHSQYALQEHEKSMEGCLFQQMLMRTVRLRQGQHFK